MKWLAVLAVGGLLFVGAGLEVGDLGMGGAPVGVVPAHGVRLLAVQELGAADVSACSGLDLNVVRAWFVQEGGGRTPDQPAYNFLFVKDPAAGTWATYSDPVSAALAVCQTLSGPLYAVVRASVGLAPILQIAALAESPWCECATTGDRADRRSWPSTTAS